MKHCCVIVLVFLLGGASVYGQSDRRKIADSPITQKYRNAVRTGFYKELDYAIASGYRGFAEFGYTFGVGDYDLSRFEISTTHGYQFNPYLFLGAGVAAHFVPRYERSDMLLPRDYRSSTMDIPIFASTRITMLNNSFSPFLDFKCGYGVTRKCGFYLSVSVGCRIASWGRQAVDIYVGYTKEDFEFNPRHTTYGASHRRKLPTDGVSLRLGYEF